MLTSTLSTERGKSRPSVSILINNYNYERFLRQCIESCLSQTQSPLEVIVVDDGSVDASSQIIRECSATSPLIVPILQANGGQASAINAGMSQCHGDVIVLLDADDYLHPWAVERVQSAWRPDCVMVQSRLDIVDREGHYIDQYPAPEVSFDSGNVVPLLLKTGQYCTTVTTGLSFSRAVLEKILPIPEEEFRICADGYLVTVAPFYGLVVALESSVGCRRKHESNLWASSAWSVAQRRRALEHDFLRYRYLTRTARSFGHEVVPTLGLRNVFHLTNRLVSLKLEPEHHPVASDRAWSLALRGIGTVWEYSNLSHRRRIVLMAWFLGVGFLPRSLARPMINWCLSTRSRPPAVDRVLKKLRTVTQ